MEQSEHRETQREVSRLTEELRLANLRADDAERKVREATERLKSVNEARLELLLCEIIQSNRSYRLAAVREAARVNESLGRVL
jgi:hypothetical protein